MPPRKPKKGTAGAGKKARKSTTRKVTRPVASKSAVKKSKDADVGVMPALQAALIGIWDWNIKTNEVHWSENVHELFGLTADGFDETFETYINLIYHEDRERVLSALNVTLNTGRPFHSEHRLVWPDGQVRWIELIGRLTLNAKSQPQLVTGTLQDITYKKKIELERQDWKTRFDLIAASAGLVIYDYDIPSGDIRWSGNCNDVLGYEPHELGNIDRWVTLIHPDDRDEAFALLESAQQKLQPYDVHYRFMKASGEYCYMHDRGFFVADTKGAAVRMLGMMSDVSEKQRAQNIIIDNVRYRDSVESAMPGILYVYDNVERKVVHANRSSLIFLGYTPEELVAMETRFVELMIHPDDHKKITRWFTEPDGSVKENEVRMKTKAGEYRWFMTRDTPFKRDADGRVIQIVGIAQDITIRKEALTQLNISEQSYRQLFDTVRDAIYIQDDQFHLIDINKGACDMLGYGKQEIIGKAPDFLIAEADDTADLLSRMNLALAGTPQQAEYWCVRKNGERFLQELMLTRGMYFGKTTLITTGRDVTERRQSEQALRESEQRFRTLQQASFGGIGLHDQGKIIDCNQGLCDLTGYSYEELVGMNGLLLISPDWRDFVFDKIKSGYGKPYDVEGIRKDGTRYILEIHGKNIPLEGRNIRVTEFRDITERKRNEEKILEQNTRLTALTEDLVRKNAQLEEFTQIVSHNLRSPVGNIVTLLNFLESADEKERAQYIALLKESSSTTLQMLNDINEVLKIKQNKNIEKQVVRFEKVLATVLTMLNAKISHLGAKVTFDFKEPEMVYPPVYMESIILNLLDNALKYSSPERKPEIHLATLKNEAGNVVLEVTDNGLGINLDKYGHHVFKLRKTFHRHPESRGIGLFMVKNQVEAMGGDITISSKENSGTTFYINFNKNHTDAS